MNLVVNLEDDEDLILKDDGRSLASYGCGQSLDPIDAEMQTRKADEGSTRD
jgi:hypothetical protein